MKKMTGFLPFLGLLLCACQGANITSAKWDSGATGPNLKTRCEDVDMRSNSDMGAVFKKYEGWKMVYVSEYTTGHKTGTHGVVCFEKGN